MSTPQATDALSGLLANSPSLGVFIVSVHRSAFKSAAVAVGTTALFFAASACAEVTWSIGIGAPAFYEPAPVYARPPPVYYQAAPRQYYGSPPPVYYPPPPVYYGAPPPVYYGPDYRTEYRHRHFKHRDREDRDD